jgi:hypothetical protein
VLPGKRSNTNLSSRRETPFGMVEERPFRAAYALALRSSASALVGNLRKLGKAGAHAALYGLCPQPSREVRVKVYHSAPTA